MKRGTARHPKTGRLMALLGIDRAKACGTLELLWHYAGEFAVQGDVGKYTNAEIAAAVDWGGDPDVLVSALIRSGWLDRDSTHRVVIHDLEDHVDQAWRRLLERRGLTFLKADGNAPCLVTDEPWLDNDGLARGMGMGMGMGNGEASQPESSTPRLVNVQPSTSQELVKQPSAKPVAVAYSVDFERCWKAYPHRPSDLKGDAWKAWRALRPDAALVEVLLEAIGRRPWKPGYQPAMARWLRGRGWEAAVEPEVEPRNDGARAREERERRVREQNAAWRREQEAKLAAGEVLDAADLAELERLRGEG